MDNMFKHFKNNKYMLLIALVTAYTGILFINQSQQLHHRLPDILDWVDNFQSGLIFLIIGILLLVNAIWDFYWYRIRVILLTSSSVMWSILATSMLLDELDDNHIGLLPILPIVMLVLTMMIAYDEPPYKMKGGENG
ncbi:hypothetical protein R078131_00815 [Convivina intestini]|nr:hypothetical protein R078131_00815 [Convivina intestini]